ncbi:MAG TPA: glycosyltransferase [Bacteroidales bacterium]|nr:glycosyltransferase [Bacteroidales bacterium]
MSHKLRLLLVSNAFYPEISPRSYRATELAREFCRQGHDVVVVTKSRSYDYTDFLKETPVDIRMWKGDKFPPVSVARRNPWALITRAIKRVMMVLFEYPAIEDMFHVRKMLKWEEGYDMMISFAVPYPVQWGVAWARNRKRRISRIWVADCGDPYMGDVLDSFRKPFYFAFLEKWFCRKAEFITIPVQSALTAYYPEFHDKIKVIPQGFRFDIRDDLKKGPGHTVPEFAYAGRFLQGIRDPRPLLEFLSATDLPFRFHVFTDQPEYLDDYRERLNDRLIVSGYIPRKELLDMLSGMDFLINFDNNTTLNIPSKLIDYSITGRPVLNIRKDFSAESIMAFLTGNYSSRMDLPDPMHYHISKVSGQFLELLNPTP